MNRGKHYKPGQTKEIIVQCILVSPDGLEEPMLRDYLHAKYDIGNQKTIKEHLEQLRKTGCLKKYEMTGLPNRWRIDKIEQFNKIFDKFPGLHTDLQINNLLISLLLQKHQSILKEPDLQKYFRSFIGDSPKFLEIFLKRSPEDILKTAAYLPEINTNSYNKYYENAEIRDRTILKIYLASKIFDILDPASFKI